MKKTVMMVLMCVCLVALTQAEVLIYDSFDKLPSGIENQ